MRVPLATRTGSPGAPLAALLAGIVVYSAGSAGPARAEGTAQFGPNQDLIELERNYVDGNVVDDDGTKPTTIRVDILNVGETINIAAGNNGGFNDVYIDVWDPATPLTSPATASYRVGPGDAAFLAGDGQSAPGSIADPIRHVTDMTGVWIVRMRNGQWAPCGGTGGACSVDPWDVTVTPAGYVGPVDPYAPPGGFGRVYSLNWTIDANSFSNCSNLDLYVLAEGGFTDTDYLWHFNADGFCGYYYQLVANSLGVQPQSGYSVDKGADPPSTMTPQYPIYLNPPEIAQPKGTTPLYVGDYAFRDSLGRDQTISPTVTGGTQDTGSFTFTTNLETFGTYAIIIDTNQNGVFDPYGEDDVLLQDFAYPGTNVIPWNGRDSFGVLVPVGAYDTRLLVRVGDFHFTAYDVEYMTPGIRIFEKNEPDGTTAPSASTPSLPTFMYWNDTRLGLPVRNNGNLPVLTSPLDDPISTGEPGDPAVPGANSHAWGVGYCCSNGNTDQSSGDNALLDTAVFGNAYSIVDRTTVVIYDGRAIFPDVAAGTPADSEDLDGDGLPNLVDPDLFDADADGDGLTDKEEVDGPMDPGFDTGDETDPLDADTDDDGISDYDEWYGTGPGGFVTHPALYDTDRDGVWDGCEVGADTPLPGGFSQGIGEPFDGTRARFEPDRDSGATTTDPTDDDTDDDGLLDGTEDANRTGVVDTRESDPNDRDSDGDGLPDGVEAGLSAPEGFDTDPAFFVADADGGLSFTDPADADTDDDGLPDNVEDADQDGMVVYTLGGLGDSGSGSTDPMLADTDGDGVQDGTELGVAVAGSPDTSAAIFVPDGDAGATTTDPLDSDTDDGGVPDGLEDGNANGVVDVAEGESDPNVFADDDTDGDGLVDAVELAIGTDPLDADTDDDGALDGAEDLSGDGVVDPGESDPFIRDTDGDGLFDGLELGTLCDHPDTAASCRPDFDPSSTTSPADRDTDDDGLGDSAEDSDGDGARTGSETAPWLYDTDGDGLPDGLEIGTACAGADTGPACAADEDPLSSTDPLVADTDGDGLSDGAEDANMDGASGHAIGGTGTPGSGETDPNDADTDGDGLSDGAEVAGPGSWGPTSPLDRDTDDGGIPDGAEVNADGTDPNDPADDVPDGDRDGIKDADEVALGTSPTDADSDDDGLSDGDEVAGSGGAGPTDPLGFDSDGDGLSDGLELGTDCLLFGSDKAICVPDSDPASVTDPNDPDTDDDGLLDGDEDADGNGDAFPGEPDPSRFDTDGDGLSDGLELGTDCADAATGPACVADADPASTTHPAIADSDGDGLSDGAEDVNGDGATGATIGGTGDAGSGETDPNVADTDGDGLLDGAEARGTGPLAFWGATDPLDTDSDDGGVDDGTEVSADQTDPNDGADDRVDGDGDGLPDGDEAAYGTDPAVADSDGDGLPDGDEAYGRGLLAAAGAGPTDPASADTDGDGLSDGLEVGADCAGAAPGCAADLSPATTTDPNDADTDDDGLLDGEEDADGNGRFDLGESSPLGGDSDKDGIGDGVEAGTDCSHPDSAPEICVADGDGGASTTDPGDADSDDDGLRDGTEDADRDGLADVGAGETDAAAFDTDGDGLGDGQELGLRASAVDADTDPAVFVADGDGGATTTDPLEADTDGGGKPDGVEDADGDGVVGPLETDPNDPADDADSDGDGLSDLAEGLAGTDPDDADSDGDGIEDLEETISGADGYLTDPMDADTDDDGLTDGEEAAGTGPLGAYGPTDPRSRDSDGDGLPDGLEVGLTDGVEPGISEGAGLEFGGTDAALFVADADAGVSTTDPNDGDSDDDGLLDGSEDADGRAVYVLGDTGSAGQGDTDPLVWDTDGDGLSDGQERGLAAPEGQGTDPALFAADADGGATVTDALDADTDDGSVADGAEDANLNGAVDAGESDPNLGSDDLDTDLDGTPDADEVAAGTDPADDDSDDDGLPDGDEASLGTDPLDADTDDDGLSDGDEVYGEGAARQETDPLSGDTDGDGLSDGLEQGATEAVEAGVSGFAAIPYAGTDPALFTPDGDGGETRTDALAGDTDGDGLDDGAEDADGSGTVAAAGETDPGDADTDDDGLLDGQEDADGDGLVSEGETDPLDTDSDGDGLFDGTELGVGYGALHPDSDIKVVRPDHDAGATTTDPLDDDTDDDGLLDGSEDADGNGVSPAKIGGTGSAGYGETDPNAADTDGDGLADGLELGLTVPQGADTAEGAFVGDADAGEGTTDPLDTDTDDGGLADGLEDHDRNGAVGIGETDPTDPADDGALDTDGDGLPDAAELAVAGLDPLDPDSDGDGLEDGVEGTADLDRDGLANAADTDADGDGVDDAVEAGLGGDADPASTTDPFDDDSDDDGLLDGSEDTNGDGAVSAGETDPNAGDSDGDGLLDGTERGLVAPEGRHTALGSFRPDADPATTTDPLDGDTDDDGLADGSEDANLNGRVSQGETDPNRYDSDADGLGDGTEQGVSAAESAGTDGAVFRADADPASTTDPLIWDTDGDGLADGAEDANGNGRVDAGETDPNDIGDPAKQNATVSSPSPAGEDCSGGPRGGGGMLGALALALLLLVGRRRARW